jgi:hypothetical protein
MVGEVPVSPPAIANYRMTNPGGYAKYPRPAMQGELPAGTDRILDRAVVD